VDNRRKSLRGKESNPQGERRCRTPGRGNGVRLVGAQALRLATDARPSNRFAPALRVTGSAPSLEGPAMAARQSVPCCRNAILHQRDEDHRGRQSGGESAGIQEKAVRRAAQSATEPLE